MRRLGTITPHSFWAFLGYTNPQVLEVKPHRPEGMRPKLPLALDFSHMATLWPPQPRACTARRSLQKWPRTRKAALSRTNVLLQRPRTPAERCFVARAWSCVRQRLPVVLYLAPFLSTIKSMDCKKTMDAIGYRLQLPHGLPSLEYRKIKLKCGIGIRGLEWERVLI